MGATVSTAKHVTAFRATSGTVVYVLFEQKYEKNVHPHIPEWSCVAMGNLSATLRQIFERAAIVESGLLQTRSGGSTPEGYIAAWLKEMAEPRELSDRTIKLRLGTDFSSPLVESNFAEVSEVLAGLGRRDVVDALAEGRTVPVSLYGEAELLSSIYGGTYLRPWRILPCPTFSGPLRPDLGYAPVAAKSHSVSLPSFLKVDEHSRLVQRADGTWYCGGWEYTIVEAYVRELWEAELQEPGSYRKRIKAYREAVNQSPPMPVGTRVEVDLTVPLSEDYQRENVQNVAERMQVNTTERGYSVEIPVTCDANALWRLTKLPRECTSWVLPSGTTTPRTEQLSLLEAA